MEIQLLNHSLTLSLFNILLHTSACLSISVVSDGCIYPVFNLNFVSEPFFLPFLSFALEGYDCPWFLIYSLFHYHNSDNVALYSSPYLLFASLLPLFCNQKITQGSNSFWRLHFSLFPPPFFFSCFLSSFVNSLQDSLTDSSCLA